MAIYLVQHGKALSKEIDENRPLSAEGKSETESIAKKLLAREIKVNKVCHSGKARAVETAEILADAVANGKTEELAGMKPNDDVVEFAQGINDACMYVGHLPHMGKLASLLTTGNKNTDVLQFSNSGVVCLNNKDDHYTIQWFIVP